MNLDFAEQQVRIEGKYPIAGTLTLPRGARENFPAILIIAGSGRSDRDGNSIRLRMNVYKDLAHILTGWGYAVLRYDKRGTYVSGGVYEETGLWDLVDDAEACVRFLKNHPQVDGSRIFLLGHSEGGMIAPAVHNRETVQGLMLLAGAADSSKNLFPRQAEMAIQELEAMRGFKGFMVRLFGLAQKMRAKNKKIMAKILHSELPMIRVQGMKINAKWIREHYQYNVMDELRKVACPTLAVTGSKDLQVIPDHARTIAETVKGESEWHIISDMTHILKKSEEAPSMLTLIKSYQKDSGKPLDPELIDIMDRWLKKYHADKEILEDEEQR